MSECNVGHIADSSPRVSRDLLQWRSGKGGRAWYSGDVKGTELDRSAVQAHGRSERSRKPLSHSGMQADPVESNCSLEEVRTEKWMSVASRNRASAQPRGRRASARP